MISTEFPLMLDVDNSFCGSRHLLCTLLYTLTQSYKHNYSDLSQVRWEIFYLKLDKKESSP